MQREIEFKAPSGNIFASTKMHVSHKNLIMAKCCSIIWLISDNLVTDLAEAAWY